MSQLFSNAARAALSSSISNVDTSLTIPIGLCDLFPVATTGTNPVPTGGLDYFKVVLQDTSGAIEIVYVRTRASGVAIMSNLLRGQEGTTAIAFAAGSVVGLRHTAQDLEAAVAMASDATAAGIALLNAATVAAQSLIVGGIPSGTRMPFAQAAAPTGWTQDTTDAATNRMLRVINTAGGGVAGTDSPIVMSVVPSHTHTYSGNTGNESAGHVHYDAGHTHGYTSSTTGTNTATYMAGGGVDPYIATGYNTATGYASLGVQSANHVHAFSGTSAANPSAANWAPRYIDMIICAKD